MKAAHDAEAHADWFDQKAQASLADPAHNIPHARVMLDAQAVIDNQRKLHARRARKAAHA